MPDFQTWQDFTTRLDTTGDCWRWLGAHTGAGRGNLYVGGGQAAARYQQAHRRAWELFHGPIPDGMNVLHKCDVPDCCRPTHLFLGTQADNLADMDAKGRRGYQGVPGARNGRAKLTDADVLEIRARHAAGETRAALARGFAVAWSTVQDIVTRRHWRHI